MFHHRKETLILAVPILFGRQINTGKFAEAVRSGIQVIRERSVMSWMWGWLPTFYSTLLLICLYLLRELLQLFLNAGLVHRKKGVIEKWHGPWCHLAVNAVSVQQFRSVEVVGSLGVFGPRVPTLQRRWGLDFCQLLNSQDLWLITCFQWFLGTRTYFLQNPKRRLIFSVLNESNSVEPEDRCSVRVDTDDECDAQFCTKFGCCHYSMLYTVTTQESLASLFLYENLLTFRPSDHPFCKFRPWLACQCKAAHCVEQCAYMWRQWPTSGPHQTCASVFFAWKSRKSEFSVNFWWIQGEFSWLQRGLATVSPFPPWFSFFSASSSRARLGAAEAWSSNNWRRFSAILESGGTKLSLFAVHIVTSHLQLWYMQFSSALKNFTLTTT